jgi:hypothetical protein
MRNKDLTEQVVEVYSQLLSCAEINFKAKEEIDFGKLMIICGQIDKYIPGAKVKYLDFKFGLFRFTFSNKEIIPNELKMLDSVSFYQ